MRVIITLPAYSAEDTLEKTVADIPAGIAEEMILVDDASPDGTVRVARDLGIRVVVHSENRGYGGNQKTCYQEALDDGADIVVMLHPDYQYDPKAVPLPDRADPRRRRRHDVRLPIRRPRQPAGRWDAEVSLRRQPDHDHVGELDARRQIHRHAQWTARLHQALPAVAPLSQLLRRLRRSTPSCSSTR